MADSNDRKKDITFDDVSAYASASWCAATLGKSDSWLRSNRGRLEGDGFPPVDLLIGHTLKADVFDWLETRRRWRTLASPIVDNDLGVNLDKL